MKKKTIIFLLSVLLTGFLIWYLRYKFYHVYSEATCTEPEICQICHKERNPALGHIYSDITKTYRICDRCKEENGYFQNPDLDCYYLVYNPEYDMILYSKEEKELTACASITKLVTVSLALDYLDVDETITIGNEIDLLKPHSSTAHLEKGDTLTVRQLVEACLIPSGNDAAYVLGYNAAHKVNSELSLRNSINLFVEMMNDYVENLGCTDSVFYSPDGYDYDLQHTTCTDLLVIARNALKKQIIRDTCCNQNKEETSLKGNHYQWISTNRFLDEESEYYNDSVTGLKTGRTPLAQNCIIVTTKHNNLEYIIISLKNENADIEYQNVQKLISCLY